MWIAHSSNQRQLHSRVPKAQDKGIERLGLDLGQVKDRVIERPGVCTQIAHMTWGAVYRM